MLLLLVGTLQSLGLMLRYRPQALLLTGGWANVPIALAAWVFRVPMLIYLPDIEPGKTIQYLSKIATKVAITVPDSAQYFQAGQTVVTGYPLRASVRSATREAAQRHFGLDPQRQTLLVFGGSRGARSINQAVAALVPAFLADGLQIIHISGTLDAAEVATAKANLTHSSHYHVYDYLEQEMGLALAVADVVIARAGASTLGEFPYFGLPSILVPYPYAWRYQKTNADWLASRGAAVRLDDEKMSSELLSTVRGILEPPRYAAMQAAAQVLAQPHGTARLAQEFVQLTGEKA
jgi:UDP-N-acetylglucosamine--N-acetylmuramyl-(pentapeptide) pyrophosphoryl-undecaprenol N-acetylglucosamine transferase